MKLKIGFKSGNVIELEIADNDTARFMAEVERMYNNQTKSNAVTSVWVDALGCMVLMMSDIEFIVPARMVVDPAQSQGQA